MEGDAFNVALLLKDTKIFYYLHQPTDGGMMMPKLRTMENLSILGHTSGVRRTIFHPEGSLISERTIMKRMFRSENDKKIAGVCGGIGEMMDVDPTIVRLLTVVLCLATGIIPFFVGYLLAWWLVPSRMSGENSGPGDAHTP